MSSDLPTVMSDLKRFQFNCVDGVEEEDKVYEKTKFLQVNEQGLHRVLPLCYLLDGNKQNLLLSNHIVYFSVCSDSLLSMVRLISLLISALY